MASRVAALILLGLLCAGLAAAQVPKDCCLSIRQEKLNPKNIVSYSIQEEGDGCQISASVFVNKHGKKLCVAHPKDFPWAQKIMNLVDKRKPASQ
ncbi:C-C motif chemokine 19 [Oryzias latipes]|uniref:C-C motif chemokine 19 n=3 Tax=Oryzias TaxID=8089 RepID=A0A3P9L5T7_ORYLA|nr:C-C motif chemokine 19 [Oryzias latipes]